MPSKSYAYSDSMLNGVKIQFLGAALSQSVPNSDPKKMTVGWYLKRDDINSASSRYRCFHFARVLEGEFENRFITDFKQLKAVIHDLDAVVVVKRLDRSLIDLAALARHLEKPIFLDLCDDLASPLYPGQDAPWLSLTILLAVAPALAGIVAPSAEMVERIRGYLSDNGLSAPPCHVVPDIAETRELFEATERFVRSKGSPTFVLPPRANGAPSPPPTEGRKQILWFGNYGGPHSNFGIFSLKPRLKKLRDINRSIPLELTVVSNSEVVYKAMVANCGFPTRYVPWSGSSVYDELDRADVVLLSTGDDDFCDVKSSNRVIQALANSTPVITERSSTLAEFEDVIFTGKFSETLEYRIGPQSEIHRESTLLLAKPILQRYTPENLGKIWRDLLKRAIGHSIIENSKISRNGLLVILDINDEPEDALAAIRSANSLPHLSYDFLVSVDLLQENQAFYRIVRTANPLPKFFSGFLNSIEAQIARKAAVVIGDRWSENGERIVELAQRLGVEVLTHREAAEKGLARFDTPQARAAISGVGSPPGPYAEHTDPDGSAEWAFVIHDKARGWILDAICQEIGSRQVKSWIVVNHSSPPPPSRNLFFSHFSLLDGYDKKYPEALATRNVFVWYTHPRKETAESIARNLTLFNGATRIIFTCESNRRLWIERGLAPEKAVVVLGAADPSLFRGHQRGGGVVGLSSSFYERKNPDLLLSVIKALPHRNFVLLGRHWNRYALFEEMLALPNFTYMTRPYRDYPQIYRMFDVFLSISSLEGGPIPLVEAMMCNAVPVASRTGFAPDLIVHGENGFLFEIDEGTSRVSDLIEQAFALDTDVRATVERYSWDQFSAEIIGLAS